MPTTKAFTDFTEDKFILLTKVTLKMMENLGFVEILVTNG